MLMDSSAYRNLSAKAGKFLLQKGQGKAKKNKKKKVGLSKAPKTPKKPISKKKKPPRSKKAAAPIQGVSFLKILKILAPNPSKKPRGPKKSSKPKKKR